MLTVISNYPTGSNAPPFHEKIGYTNKICSFVQLSCSTLIPMELEMPLLASAFARVRSIRKLLTPPQPKVKIESRLKS